MDPYETNPIRDSSSYPDQSPKLQSFAHYTPHVSPVPAHQEATNAHQTSSQLPSRSMNQFASSSFHSSKRGVAHLDEAPQTRPLSDLGSYSINESNRYEYSPAYPPPDGSHGHYYTQGDGIGPLISQTPHLLSRHHSAHSFSSPDPPHEDGTSDESVVEYRRTTVTQQTYRDQLAQRNKSHSPATPPTGGHFHPPSVDATRFDSRRLNQTEDVRDTRHFAPYQRRNTIKPTTAQYAGVGMFQPHRQPTPEAPADYARSTRPNGGINIPQVPILHTARYDTGGATEYARSHPMSQSLPSHPSGSFWPPDYMVASAPTPTYTEGSADPAQSDQDENDPHTPASATSSSTASSTASRWARFRVPDDIFTRPPDPARHELYHRIRQEAWYINQQPERGLAPHEANRIPGSMPGESVLLAFYDRIQDSSNKAAMRCTICAQTNPDAQLYPRPDRAKVHMRHHFELRPIPCVGGCGTPQCSQRFFTHSDLTAHVTGKTEPLATCSRCNKTLRQKNLKRHMTQYCQAANRR